MVDFCDHGNELSGPTNIVYHGVSLIVDDTEL
jgi:hypothetical protein